MLPRSTDLAGGPGVSPVPTGTCPLDLLPLDPRLDPIGWFGAGRVELPLRDAMHVWPPTQTIVAELRTEAAQLAA